MNSWYFHAILDRQRPVQTQQFCQSWASFWSNSDHCFSHFSLRSHVQSDSMGRWNFAISLLNRNKDLDTSLHRHRVGLESDDRKHHEPRRTFDGWCPGPWIVLTIPIPYPSFTITQDNLRTIEKWIVSTGFLIPSLLSQNHTRPALWVSRKSWLCRAGRDLNRKPCPIRFTVVLEMVTRIQSRFHFSIQISITTDSGGFESRWRESSLLHSFPIPKAFGISLINGIFECIMKSDVVCLQGGNNLILGVMTQT
jgi:hypothetical protein